MAADRMTQNIITGIQTVGQVKVKYRYNSVNHILGGAAGIKEGINTSGGIELAGFRLDDDFLQANPQIASSLVVPILGGGGIALTNSNRSGQLTLSCVRAGTPENPNAAVGDEHDSGGYISTNDAGGVRDASGTIVKTVYDPIMIAQIQQAQEGGDSNGAELLVAFGFNQHNVLLQFTGCTVSQCGIIHLAGNNVPGYGVVWNYLNWGIAYNVVNPETFAAMITSTGNLMAVTTDEAGKTSTSQL